MQPMRYAVFSEFNFDVHAALNNLHVSTYSNFIVGFTIQTQVQIIQSFLAFLCGYCYAMLTQRTA